MTFPVSSAASQAARHAPPPPVDNAARAGARQADAAELALDVTQMALDIVGLVDPTPISDGVNGLISLGRGDWLGAGISAVSMIPYLGDAAKLGKLGRYAETMANAVDLAKANPAIAKQLGPAMEKLREAFGHIPLDKLPQPMREALAPIKSKLDDFARIGVHTVQTTVGRNSVEWTQNAAGETIRAKATLNEVFSGASRSSKEATAQGQAAARGIADDVGGHIIGHRFVKDQGIRNMFPQNAQFNNSAFRKLENEWADWISKKGGSVEVEVQLIGNATRPDKVHVKYSLIDADGQRVDKFSRSFENKAGQTYDRQYFR